MAEIGSGLTLHSSVMMLRRRKWWVITIALLGLAFSLGLSLTEPERYSATAQLLVQSTGQAVNFGPQAVVTTTDVQTDLQLATSAPVLGVVRRKLGSAPPVSTADVAQTNVIALTAVSSTPARAALIANTYARAFVGHSQSVAIGEQTAAETKLRAQIAALERQIKSAQQGPGSAPVVSALADQEGVFKQEVAQLQVGEAMSTGGVEFVTPAQAPSSPSSPKPDQDALLGLAAGLMLGAGAAFLRDSFDDALSSQESTERVGGAPVLAMVPMVNSWKKRGQAVVVSSSEPTSPAAEAYRSLRTSLQFARHVHELRTLLVTSPAASEGKTSTLANLGAAFAQAGERVVLVSCDLRRPRLGQFFGVEEQSGLTTVILGQQTLEEALQPVRGYDCLWVLGAGPIPPNPAELLNAPKVGEVFAALEENFDLVLVDSPPVLPVTDAMVLSNYADGTLLVVAAGQTRRAELRRVAERFAQAKSAVVGIVLNEVTKQSGYDSSYGYREGYAYQSYEARASLMPVQANGGADAGNPAAGRRRHRTR
jgi:polysaccharide biosynthesis transport protein